MFRSHHQQTKKHWGVIVLAWGVPCTDRTLRKIGPASMCRVRVEAERARRVLGP